VVLGLLYATRGYSLSAAARFLDVGEPPQPADCVLVLGGGSNTRPFVGAALLKAGLAKKVLLPTVQLSVEAQDGLIPPDHELIEQALRHRGVPNEAIVRLPHACATTFDEAEALREYLEDAPATSVTVVTTTHHTRRAQWIFRRVLGDKANVLRFVSAPTDGFDASNWWRYEEGCAAYLSEYVKLAFYLWQYH
jgi:uncharacterized SAM-binding protein YcdF (DUF218 family)